MNKMDLKDGLAVRLGIALEKSGMSTKEAAKKCGIAAATMATYISTGNANLPGLTAFTEICEVLHVSADWLLFGKDKV